MRALIFGGNGQVGYELIPALSPFAAVHAPTRAEVDLLNPAGCAAAVEAFRPNVVINAAAYTDVDRAEREVDAAWCINAASAGAIADAAARIGAGVVHYSTDFVFDGAASRPYVETDAPAPLSVYGRSKLEGEHLVLASGAAVLVLRTSWVYSSRRRSFLTAIRQAARKTGSLRVVTDQVGSPTFCRDLALVTAAFLYAQRANPVAGCRALAGVYNVAGAGACSRFEMASFILAHDPLKTHFLATRIDPISSDAWPTPAVRPKFSALDCSKAWAALSIALPNWQDSLMRAMSDIQGHV